MAPSEQDLSAVITHPLAPGLIYNVQSVVEMVVPIIDHVVFVNI